MSGERLTIDDSGMVTAIGPKVTNTDPPEFIEIFVLDGVHSFSRALKCTKCDGVIVGEGNTPEMALKKATLCAKDHVCSVHE